VRVDEASVQSLTADIFNETGLAGGPDAFRDAFTELAREGRGG
jgi:heterodisulfide reductase subunit D